MRGAIPLLGTLEAVSLLSAATMNPPADAGAHLGDPGAAKVFGSRVRAKDDHHATACRASASCGAVKTENTGCATEALGPELVPS